MKNNLKHPAFVVVMGALCDELEKGFGDGGCKRGEHSSENKISSYFFSVILQKLRSWNFTEKK